MSGNYSTFVKGMTTGLVVGAAVAIFADPMSDRQHNKMRKKTHGIFKNLGGILDNAIDMIK